MTEQMTEVKRCRCGIKTDTPCPFVATEPAHYNDTDEPEMCAYHAADQPLYDEIDEYVIALDKLSRYLKDARGDGNLPLTKDLERLEKDYRERLDFFEGVTDDLMAANKKVTVYMGK